ncbi:hypothetical protein H4582DRAFT_160236 [Lactarius indigo]|nr:hypothetical protein H4582DRAFT_160236 [Lactarius indigo]
MYPISLYVYHAPNCSSALCSGPLSTISTPLLRALSCPAVSLWLLCALSLISCSARAMFSALVFTTREVHCLTSRRRLGPGVVFVYYVNYIYGNWCLTRATMGITHPT